LGFPRRDARSLMQPLSAHVRGGGVLASHPLPQARGPWSRSLWRPLLRGRRGECELLDRQLQGVAAGQSSVQVLRGEAGVGKTALLEYVAEQA